MDSLMLFAGVFWVQFIASFMLWPVLIVFMIISWGAINNDHQISGSILIVVVLYALFSRFPTAVDSIVNNKLWAACGMVVYLLVGACWATVKWVKYVFTQKTIYNNILQAYIKEGNLPANYFATATMGDSPCKEMRSKLIYAGFASINPQYDLPYAEVIRGIIPQVREHKKAIVSWMSLWPASCIWWVATELLSDVFGNIFNVIHKRLQQFTNDKFVDLV